MGRIAFRVSPDLQAGVSLLAMGLLAACAVGACGATTESGLSVIEGAGGAGFGQTRADFSYRSSTVDVEATLITQRDPARCHSSGRLLVDKFAARADRYVLEDLPCAELELTSAGDILLHASPTGHDWTEETLQVDSSREIITLGPWTNEGPSGKPYVFELSAPPCGGDCECAQLVRRSGEEVLMIELARRCE